MLGGVGKQDGIPASGKELEIEWPVVPQPEAIQMIGKEVSSVDPSDERITPPVLIPRRNSNAPWSCSPSSLRHLSN